MKELLNLRQPGGEPHRRWFRSDDADLIVWYEPDGSFFGFQLCYDRQGSERAFTWLKHAGCSHLKVDDGEVEPLTVKRTPVLMPDHDRFDAERVLQRFHADAGGLPEDLARLVSEKISQYRAS